MICFTPSDIVIIIVAYPRKATNRPKTPQEHTMLAGIRKKIKKDGKIIRC